MMLKIATIFLMVSAFACSKDESKSDKAQSSPQSSAATSSVASTVNIKVEMAGYTPSSVNAEKDKELTMIFTRVADSTCGEKVVIPAHDIEKDLPLNEPVPIKITPKETGTLAFVCGMNMMKGAIVVK